METCVKNQDWEDRAAEPVELFAIGAEGEEGTDHTKVVQEFEGKYLNTKQTEENGDSLLHVFDMGKDRIVGLWGFYRLDKALEEIPTSTPVRIKYIETTKLDPEKGDKSRTMKVVKVQVPPGTPRVRIG